MRRLHTVLRQIRARPRLASSTCIGVATALLLPRWLPPSTRGLLAWDIGVGLYLSLAWAMMTRASVEHIRWRARIEDDGAAAVLLLTLLAAGASLAAIVLELAGIKTLRASAQGLHLMLAGATILVSWTFVHTAFALHYAHEYYVRHQPPERAALEFPHQPEPGYWDFLYFSFVIGTTSQTADVNIASTGMRRLALLHGVVAFVFNTTLLALTINVAAGLA